MKQLFTLILLISTSLCFSQDFKQEWKEVIQFELDGKVKSAHEAVNAIYKKAKRKKIEDQIVKCFFYQSKFIQATDEKAQSIILKNLNQEITEAKGCQKALLNFIYATILEKYFQNNRYELRQRTNLPNQQSNDVNIWTTTDFEREIDSLYQNLLQDEKALRATNLKAFASILEISPYTDSKKMTVFDFLREKVIDHYSTNVNRYNTILCAKIFPELYKNPIEFVQFKTDTLSDKNLKKLIEIYQSNEKYCLKNKNEDINVLQYQRMKKFNSLSNTEVLYFSQLLALEQTATNTYLLQNIRVDKARYFFSQSSKESKTNYYPEALAIIETVLNSHENPDTKAEAETLKEQILSKKISLNIPPRLYANQNYRAFVNFKNIDTVKVSYYKIPVGFYKKLDKEFTYDYSTNNGTKRFDKDSLLVDYIQKNKPFKSELKVLPTKNDHFEYTTEILMENLDLGFYLLYFETENPYAYGKKTAYAYHLIQVSNIDYLKESDDDFDIFQTLNRKTGQPLQGVKISNNETTQSSDKSGKVKFDNIADKDRKDYFSELLFVKDKDTLVSSYQKSINYDSDDSDDDKEFEAKTMVFFDRAIYRPGQKVYFKGFIFKNKNNVKSVVPKLTIRVYIENENSDELKSFEVQTNEFGSFTGEYDIPKNILPGEFSISIDEPDDYEVDTQYYDPKEEEHLFWDYANYNEYERFTFKVEEYKRPTFEIIYDQIKENYTIGDKIIVNGNAKTLAGSNLTNAKVNFTVSKRINGKGNYYRQYENFINSETTTDENGNFNIYFEATQDSVLNENIETFNFSVEATITDLNGETRTAKTEVTVGQEMLKLKTKLNSILYFEDKNLLQIIATTLNNFPINTKGTITIIEQKQKEFLIKKERYPELLSIDRKTYETLFPFEAYSEEDSKIQENEILSLPFDTEKTTLFDLAMLKNYKPGKYSIVLEAEDKNGNLIDFEQDFVLSSKKNKATHEKLFVFNQVETDKDYFVFEIQSVIPDLYIITRIFDDSKKNSEITIQLKNGVGLVKFPKATHYENSVQFHFATVWENNYHSDFETLFKEEMETKLKLEVLSFRNKIEPGSQENWSFIVKNSKLQSEVLASMYDTSLDQFAVENWDIVRFYRRRSLPDVNHEKEYWYENNVVFENLGFYSKYYKTYFQEPKLEWFGFDFSTKNNYLNNQYLKKMEAVASIPKNAKATHGIVSDASGPLPGAVVYIKGTNRTTQTDFDGYYEIDTVPGEILIFSFTGYNSISRAVGTSGTVNARLEDGMKLNEVIVQGYGKTATKSKTVSAQMVINKPDVNNAAYFVQTLKGQLQGTNIALASGQPGGQTMVVIRGESSLNNSKDPLFVIDGIPLTEAFFRNLDPNDIESVTVLKDAAATSIYGNRGANGVIIINTKKGMKEFEQVQTRTNFNETAFFYPNLTTDEKGQISFGFTSPESLTKWRLRLFAHNKKAENGYFQTEIVSQKDIMVMPNMPRFVREKDTINFAVKVVNMSLDEKSGNAVLLLYDAATNAPIDAVAMNKDNTKVFSCQPKQSAVINWTVAIPEGVQGIRYKVIAKSGDLSDGEENILPVLANKILVTESIPIWVKGNTKREFTLANLKNNASPTLKHQAFTLEYTSNPVWLALQSLPYLMTYEHECAEQTFAKYYANCIAEKIITKNPKIESLLKKWQNLKTVESKLKLNEELKSIVLAETPWLMDAENDEQKNQRLAILMDLNTLKENNEKTLQKVQNLQLDSGGFAWFGGGTENRYISQHILSGIGHLNKLFPEDSSNYQKIVSNAIPNLDQKFISDYKANLKIGIPEMVNLNYLYARSFFLKDYPLSKKCDSIVKLQLAQSKKDWSTYSTKGKGYLALIMNRFNEKEFAKKIIAGLKESVSNNDEIGMYWIDNKNSCDWFGSSIETQALLIEAFAEIDQNKDTVDAMKVWLIKNKQSNRWSTTKSTTEAIYALLYQGNDWVSLKGKTNIKVGDEKVLTQKLTQKEDEMESGYLKLQFSADEISSKTATITIENKSTAPGFGGAYWQYFETLENIKKDSTEVLSIDKKLFKKIKTTAGEELIALDKQALKVGDLLTVRLIIKSNSDLDFVHLKDLRASCLEPVDVISGYEWKFGLGFYKSSKDTATHFFFDSLKKGTYVLEYDLRITNNGVFNNGISTLQSMYAPEFGTHSENTKITVK